jgi:hypothetical protein
VPVSFGTLSTLDIIIKRPDHNVEFHELSRRWTLWQLLPDGDRGITIEELLSISPFTPAVLRETIRFLRRVDAIEIQRDCQEA